MIFDSFPHIKATGKRWKALLATAALTFILPASVFPREDERPVCDIEAAREVCDTLPLDNIEGIWLYPDDRVTVFIRRLPDASFPEMPAYIITAIESSDCRIIPGEMMGRMTATPEASKYNVSLRTDKTPGRKNAHDECVATLSKEGDSMILSKEKSKFRLRMSLNPNSLLPTLWKSLLRFGISVGSGNDPKRPSPGMIKVYPVKEGQGIKRNRPRYL